MILTVFAFLFVVAMAAVAIDLASVRNDRADNQVAADHAAAAGIVAHTDDGGIVGCQRALTYLQANLAYTMTGADCSSFPDRCFPSTTSVSTTGVAGDLSITITHPVDDNDPLMQPAAIGAANLPITDADGDRCSRIGVAVTEIHRNYFGGFLGIGQLTSTVHTVALDGTDSSAARSANLVLLERHECDVLTASNGAGDGGIRVRAVVEPSGEIQPGRIAVDSDGTVNCNSKGTIDVDGTNALIQADGPPYCASEVGVAGSGDGCGILETYAPGPPGCVMPACNSSGIINPAPNQMEFRVTRAPVDHRWNCKASYPVAYDIDGCYLAGYDPPYIDQLVAAIGSSGIPSGFTSYTAAGHDCNLSASEVETVPFGNWVVDCNLKINGQLTFRGGNVVFDDDVSLQSDGSLAINDINHGTYGTWSEGDALDHTISSEDAAFLYIRDGEFSKAGQATVLLNSTMVYLAPTTNLKLAGGSGVLEWTSPTEGPFTDLAMWSDSDVTNIFGGQSTLFMEGVFFAPLAVLDYTGNGNQQQVAAQYVVEKLHVSGQGRLEIIPDVSRGVIFPRDWPTVLIR
jgi:hypothetical protein